MSFGAFPKRKAWAWKSDEDNNKWCLSVMDNRKRPWNTYDTKDLLAAEARTRDLDVIWETKE